MNYKVVVEGEVSLSLPLDGDTGIYLVVDTMSADDIPLASEGSY